MQQIFISYSRKEEQQVRDIADALVSANISIWLDIHNIVTGENWRDAIQRGLDDSSMMILVMTPNAMESEQVSNEWHYYLDEGKPIIPILLEPSRIHFQLRPLQYIDFHSQSFDLGVDALVKAIGEHSPSQLNPQEALVLEMLESAYKYWLNFDRSEGLLLDKRQLSQILETMTNFPLSDSLWRYLLASIGNMQHKIEADSAIITALQSLDENTLTIVMEPLLVHPLPAVRLNVSKMIRQAELKSCSETLKQCVPNESDEQTIVAMIHALDHFEVDIPQSLLSDSLQRVSQWHFKSQLLGMMQQDTKNLLFISDGTDLAEDFHAILEDVGFNIIDVNPNDLLMMPFTLRQVEGDLFKPYDMIFIIKGEHFSTINYESFYDKLAQYLRAGGLLFATAWVAWESQENTTLASILPFQYEKFKENIVLKCNPTEEAIAADLFTDNFSIMSSFEYLNSYDDTHVLLEDKEKNPIFGFRYVGEGRTFYLNSCQHSCTKPFDAQTRQSEKFKLAMERVFKWLYDSV